MIIRIPFTNYMVGDKKSINALKQATIYGAMANEGLQGLMGGGYRIGFRTLYEIYNNVSDIKAGVRKIQLATCRDGAKKCVRFVSSSNEEKDMSESQSATKILSVIDSPHLSFRMMINRWQRDRRVAGNSYLLILRNRNKEVIGLQSIDPRTMAVIADKFGNVLAYKQEVFGQKVIIFQPEEIIHTIFDDSTNNPTLGCSPLESIVWDARAEMASAKTNYVFYKNNAVPSHLYIVKKTLSAEQVAQLKDNVEKEFKGSDNKFKSGFMPYVEDIKTISPSQKEMEYIESRKFTTKKVAVALAVDAFLLGYTEGVQRSNGKIIERDFYENTIRPDEMYLENVLNNELLPAMGIEDVKVRISASAHVSEDEVYDRSRQDVKVGIITRNEARQMRGLPDSDNELADELVIDGTPLDDVGEELKKMKGEVELERLKDLKKTKSLLDVRYPQEILRR